VKKALILSLCFAPDNAIGAIRPTKVAKYLKLNAGYEITAITTEYDFIAHGLVDPLLQKDLQYVDNHIVLKLTSLAKLKFSIFEIFRSFKHSGKAVTLSPSPHGKKTKSRFFHKIFSYLNKYFSYGYSHSIHKNLSKIATKYILKNPKHYDVIYAPFGLDYYLDIAADAIRQQNLKAFWISNFGDPMIDDQLTKRGTRNYEKYVHRVVKTADAITGVSDICLRMFVGRQTGKLCVFYNGFDRDELNYIVDASPSCKFTLTYTGHLYSGERDLRTIFRALRELIDENKISRDNIAINYAGKHESEFLSQVSQFNLNDESVIHGFVDRYKALRLQMESTILISASWNRLGYTDVITGKFYEQLMIGKPILCTITGNLPNSKLKEMIMEANVGIVWEEPTDRQDYPALKSYILMQYERFIRGEPPLFEPNLEYIEKYNHKNITQQHIDLVEKHYANADAKAV